MNQNTQELISIVEDPHAPDWARESALHFLKDAQNACNIPKNKNTPLTNLSPQEGLYGGPIPLGDASNEAESIKRFVDEFKTGVYGDTPLLADYIRDYDDGILLQDMCQNEFAEHIQKLSDR